ncbi:MAG: putative glycoside hydrolase [Candidatus Rokubacteria bacterium]|nr:putative glycoside hydrolase [Candidatus Rokubacteria bacterium]
MGDKGIRGRVFDLLNRTELNAVVIDVKGDRGWIPYRTQVPLAPEAGAQGPVIIKEFDQMLADLKAQGVYTIARIVVFKDNVLAHRKPEWAVIDTRTDQPWLDREGLAWLDPFREEVWDYAIAVAREAAQKGFDEIQFDYVRFPTDGKLAAARYYQPNTRETRLRAIAGFLARARKELAPMGVFLAADIFGYTAFNENDTDIGQRVEDLAEHLDYLSPMVYPSGYHLGIPRYRNPVEHPYEVVFESIKLLRKRTAGFPVKVRPWIQDFRDYAFDRRPFGVKEVRAQVKAAGDAGAVGWMLWNPRNDYTVAALQPKPSSGARPAATR